MNSSRKASGGFTLVELLAVIAIIAVLVTILVPYLGQARELANRARCQANTKVLVQAAMSYCDMWKVMSPYGWGPKYTCNPPVNYTVLYYWYQKELLGQYFGEVVDANFRDGWAPPRKSVLRCPTWSSTIYNYDGVNYLVGNSTWIGYNSSMSYDCQPLGSGIRCFWRGPRLDEILTSSALFVLFADGRSASVYNIGKTSYCDPSPPYDDPDSISTTDGRHNGGTNFGYLDGHVKYFPDATEAHHLRQVLVSAAGVNANK